MGLRGKSPTAQYALYKGDDLLFIGTALQCAKFRGVKVETIQWQATRTARERLKLQKNPDNAFRVIRIEEDDDE